MYSELAGVAHAGGSIDGAVYTNSLAAFDRAYGRGFRLIEVDFQTTSDGVVVCGHDWDAYGGTPPSEADLLRDRAALSHPPCTLEDLFGWFSAHADARLVSDAKDDAVAINRSLEAQLGGQLVAQAYSAAEVVEMKLAGIETVVLTLYRVGDFWAKAAEISALKRSGHDVWALTLPAADALGGLGLWAKLELDTPVYAHTVNACWLGGALDLLGVDALYTDDLAPGGCP